MISGVFLQFMEVSMLTLALIGILLAMVPLLQKRYHAKWRYIVWLAAAVRLLVPLDIPLPHAPVKIELPTRISEIAAAERSITPVNIPVTKQPQPEIFAEPDSSVQNMGLPAFTPIEIIGLIWVIGVLVFLIFQVLAYQKFLHRLKKSKKEPVSDYIANEIRQIGIEMGVRKPPEPVITTAVDAPVLIGILRPRILLPRTQYRDEELSFILRHELVHYRRKDILYKLVLFAANALHWFNPLVYLMVIQASKDIELACDDDVTRGLDGETRAGYGEMLLSVLPKKGKMEPVFSTHFGSGKKTVKNRLRNIFDTTAKRRGAAALCAVIICVAVVTGFMAFDSNSKPEGDGYVPIDGLSFGMSVDEVRELYPEIRSADYETNYSYESNEFKFPDLPRVMSHRAPFNNKMQLDDIKVYGIDSTVNLTFGRDPREVNGERYIHYMGLTRVEIVFNDLVDGDEILTNLPEIFDISESRFSSKATVENMDEERRAALKEYMSNLSFTDAMGEKSQTVDCWPAVESTIEYNTTGGQSYSMSSSMRYSQLFNFAYGDFNSLYNMLAIDGPMAAYLYNTPS